MNETPMDRPKVNVIFDEINGILEEHRRIVRMNCDERALAFCLRDSIGKRQEIIDAHQATIAHQAETIAKEKAARITAEKQRDCSHRQTSWGICNTCGFDYRTYDCDDNKCGKCGSWRDHKLMCPRCEPELSASRAREEKLRTMIAHHIEANHGRLHGTACDHVDFLKRVLAAALSDTEGGKEE